MTPDLSLDYTPERRAELEENIKGVLNEIPGEARLVPISKLKPASDIQALYDAGYRHFGENYIQELVDKAAVLPKDIKWHFVGGLQSNKSKLAASIPNLHILESLPSQKVADLLERALAEAPSSSSSASDQNPNPEDTHTLGVYIQINTSSESSKSGVEPGTAPALARHIVDACPHLRLRGLMTIGSWDASHADAEAEDGAGLNPDFESLKAVRGAVARELGKREDELELSMGMSADFVQAVKQGSSSVRVGTRIFGERPKRS